MQPTKISAYEFFTSQSGFWFWLTIVVTLLTCSSLAIGRRPPYRWSCIAIGLLIIALMGLTAAALFTFDVVKGSTVAGLNETQVAQLGLRLQSYLLVLGVACGGLATNLIVWGLTTRAPLHPDTDRQLQFVEVEDGKHESLQTMLIYGPTFPFHIGELVTLLKSNDLVEGKIIGIEHTVTLPETSGGKPSFVCTILLELTPQLKPTMVGAGSAVA